MVQKVKQCVICNNNFIGHHSRKTCSEQCKILQNRKSYKKATKKYKDKIKKTENYVYKTEKKCYSCKEKKEIIHFAIDKSSPDGFTWNCKKCRNEIKKQKRQTENYKKTRRNYQNEKRKNDVFYRLRKNFSSMFWKCLKENKVSKTLESKLSHLHYSLEELKQHLENQFDDKMTWENYGTYWHIDHIIPQSKLPFDSFNHPNFQKCWSLENLRPLEKIENIKKGNKILGEINE